MRRFRNFHPEWGYLAPAPGFIRLARVALVAATIGAIFGAAAIFFLVGYRPTEVSVSARTLVGSPETALPQPDSAELTNRQSAIAPSFLAVVGAQSKDEDQSRFSACSARQAPERIAASTATAPPIDSAAINIAIAGPTAAVGMPARDPARVKMKSMKKLDVPSRDALHGEPLRLTPREKHPETGTQARSRNVESRSGWFYAAGAWSDQSLEGSTAALLLTVQGILKRALGESIP